METDLQLCTHTETHCSSPRASYRQTCRNLMVLYRSNIISTSTFSNYHCTLCFPSCVGLCTYVCLRVSRSSLCKNSRKMNPAPPLVFPGMADNFSAQLRRHARLQAAAASLGLEDVWRWGWHLLSNYYQHLAFTAVKVIRGDAYSRCKVVSCTETQREKHVWVAT